MSTQFEKIGKFAGSFTFDGEKAAELEAMARKMFEAQGFIGDPVTDEEWAAMEKYPPVPLTDYQEIERQAFKDYVTAIEARPGYFGVIDDAVVEQYLEATRQCIAAAVNCRKVFPFEVCADDLFMFLPKNRRRVEGDYIVVAK